MAEELPAVAVRGEASLEVSPEIALVWVSVSAQDTDRFRALQTVTERQRAVRSVLDDFAAALENLGVSHVQVAPRYPKRGQGEAVVGYTARAFYSITIADVERVGELLTRLAEVDSAHVDGPSWSLRPSSPAHRRARRAAVDDALIRAADYATALGGGLTGLLEIADTGLLGKAGHRRERMPAAEFAATPASAGEQPELDVASGRQLVRATVEARFSMTVPTLPQPPE